MAILRVQKTGQEITDPSTITAALASHGVVHETWDVGRLAESPRAAGESDQDHVLRVFADEVARISAVRGYRSADVISVWPTTPGLDAMIAKFDKEHIHTADEVRFVVSGRGVFTVRGADGELYDVEAHPGDLLVVPAGARHWFTLCDDRHIQCIRIHTGDVGWVAQYV